MNNSTKAFIEKFQADVQKLRQLTPDTVKGFGTLFSAVMKDGALTTKQKELVALGIAVAQRCSPCIILHVQKCLEAGCSKAEIMEAASVAVMMQGGPAYTHLPVVLDAIEALTQNPKEQTS